MTCDRLKKCFDKRDRGIPGDRTKPQKAEFRRDREVHQRLIKQAPRYYIPTTRIDFRFWKKTEEIVKENLDYYDYYPFGVVSPFGQ